MSAAVVDGGVVEGSLGENTRVVTRRPRPHADAGIIFGSAASSPARKPDSVRATCEAIGLARSTYYYQSHRSASAIDFEQRIVLRLHELKRLHPDDGYRRMTQHLQVEGFRVNRKRIARLMHLHSLTKGPARKDHCTPHNLPHCPSPPTREISRITGPYQKWITDVSYAHIPSCLVYAAAVIDAWSREVVGYAASLQITNRLARIALHSAVRAHRPAPGCVHHSLCGSQYLTRSYCELLRQYGLVPSSSDVATTRHYSATARSHEIVEVQGYTSWRDVIDHPREFIQALYSPAWIDEILGTETVSPTELPSMLAN